MNQDSNVTVRNDTLVKLGRDAFEINVEAIYEVLSHCVSRLQTEPELITPSNLMEILVTVQNYLFGIIHNMDCFEELFGESV